MKKLKIFLLSFALLLAVGLVTIAIAQEIEEEVTEAVNLDENIQPEDFGISEPRLLPDSPLYFLKNWARGIRSFLTFNPVKKAELKMKFANEKLMEVKKMIERKKDPEKIKKATENYQQEIEKIKEVAEKIREKAKENPKVESFLDKFIHQQTLHQKLLDRLETQVPPQAFEKIKEARERHLERFKDVMLKLEDRKEKIAEKLEKILEKQKGSEFKEFKNLEVLKRLEEKVPEAAKEVIQETRVRIMEKFQKKLEKMAPEKQERLKDYLEKISGEKGKQLEIMEDVRTRIQAIPTPTAPILQLKKKLEKGREKILKKVEEKLERLDCPLWEAPPPDFCKEGRIIIEKNPETGCPLPPKCIIPGEIEIPEKPEKPQACITLWDPVCGKDGKTYSNACFAKMAGVEIDYKGKCREKECVTDADCPQPKCGPAGTISAKCLGVTARCIEGKCQIQPIHPIQVIPERE